MTAWLIVIAALLLILLTSVGADASYDQKIFSLKLKIGLLSIAILPKKKKTSSGTSDAPSKPKPPKEEKPKKEKKLHITGKDIPELLRILFRTLRLFRLHLSIDRLRLHWTAAAEDPYDAVVQYGALNAGVSSVLPLAEEVLKIREKDICIYMDFEAKKPEITAALTATLQIWEILLIAFSAAWSMGKWYLRKRKQPDTAVQAAEQKGMG